MMKNPPEQMLANSDGNVAFISRDWKKTQTELTNSELGYNVKDLAIEKESLEQELITNRNGKDAGAIVDMSEQQARIDEIEALETMQGKFTYKLVSDVKTSRGTPPSWAVVQVDEYGLPSPVNDSNGIQKRWTVNYADTPEFKEAKRLEKAELERSRKEREFRESANYEAVMLDRSLKMIF